jgi:hypothetical protein
MNQHSKALRLLKDVARLAPKESVIFLKMGHLYKIAGKTAEALKSYLTALDLSPKLSSTIKEAIESLNGATPSEIMQELTSTQMPPQ